MIKCFAINDIPVDAAVEAAVEAAVLAPTEVAVEAATYPKQNPVTFYTVVHATC